MSENGIRVLLIEDDPTYSTLLARTLSRESNPKFEVSSADRLETGLERLSEGETDVVILDLSLPDSKGVETFSQVHNQVPTMPIIVLTGYDDDSLGLEAVGKGAQDYLVKGQVDTKMLSRVMRYAIERKRAQEALAEQAIRDALTNLYNRRYLTRRMEEELRRAEREHSNRAILLCDLDNFKVINDTQGHQAGDEVLKAVAKSIQESTRGTDLVFRWGGDEIVVILTESSREGIVAAAERIRKGVQRIGEISYLGLDLSIGVALYPDHGQTVDDLIRLADQALYIAKKGGDKIHIGTEEFQIDEKSIKVVYQPVVDLRTDQTIGYEALSRDPQGKLTVLELFKKYQAIGQLGELKRICFRSQVMAAQKAKLNRVFVNVDFAILAKMEVLPKDPNLQVILEISEAEALHDIENHLLSVRKWREAGYRFAIDDFGAGFISLPFIARLVPDYIKLDRTTILQAIASEKFKQFLKDMVKALQNYVTEGIIAEGIEPVAERIETEKELEVVKEMGIYLMQGFLTGEPRELP